MKTHGDRLPGAVPMICKPGDVVIANRNCLHASYPNTSGDLRITLNFGFHKRAAVLGAKPDYSAARIDQRSRIIALAVDARRQRFPEEISYCFSSQHPCSGRAEVYTSLEDSRLLTEGPNLGI